MKTLFILIAVISLSALSTGCQQRTNNSIFNINSFSIMGAVLPPGPDIPTDPVDPPPPDIPIDPIDPPPVEPPPPPVVDCSFNGSTVRDGDDVTAFQSSTVPWGQSCTSEQRVCRDGHLEGSYQYGSCSVGQPASCLFDGQTILHGDSVTAYISSAVSWDQSCATEAQIRTCTNGVLSGNAQYSTCNSHSPQSCLFDGLTVPHGDSVVAYQASTTQYGGQCTSENRVCTNGALSGNFQFSSCAIDQPASCLFNGSTVVHGASVIAFMSASVPNGQTCQSQNRVCDNGTLSGSATQTSCVVEPPTPTPTPGSCTEQGIRWEFPSECHGHCGKGVADHKSRYSRDGGKTWLTITKNKTPEDLQAIWNYLIKKHGENRCDRPNVAYSNSKNKGFILLDLSSINLNICNVCRFEEVEQSTEHHGQCGRNKKKSTIVKYICGEIKPSPKKKKPHHRPIISTELEINHHETDNILHKSDNNSRRTNNLKNEKKKR